MSSYSHLSSPSAPGAGNLNGQHSIIRRLISEAVAAQTAGLPWALLAVAVAAALLATAAYVLAVTGQPLSILVRDANAIAHQPNYFGALEHAEILLMDGAGFITVFAAFHCRGVAARFLFLGGLLSLLLAADDLYMFHESAWRFHLNEKMIFALYAVLLIALAAANFRYFLKTPFFLLGIALVFFALGIVVDSLPQTPFGLPGGTEDCLELIGICFWSAYFIKNSRDALLAARQSRAA